MHRRIPWSLAIAVIATAMLLLFATLRPVGHRLLIKAYFDNGIGLHAGAAVRLAGVDVGAVKSVRALPERKEDPVEVILALSTPYELKIPNDSTVSLETAGLLGETFVQIDSTKASGPPLQQNAILKAKAVTTLSTGEVGERLRALLEKKPCDLDMSAGSPGKKPVHATGVSR